MPGQHVQPGPGEEFRRQQAGHGVQRLSGQRVHLAGPLQPDDHGDRVGGPGDKLDPDRGDHGERPFRAGQQARVVVPGVVLDQPGQVRHHGAVGEHRLHAAHLGPHRPVAQHPQAARVGRYGPAHGGALPTGDNHPEVEPRLRVRDPLQ
jgi:hypothetical protein